MKTAEDWLAILTLTEPEDARAFVSAIQTEAFKQGLLEAAKIADAYVNSFATNSEAQNICGIIRDDIVASSKIDLTEPPF